MLSSKSKFKFQRKGCLNLTPKSQKLNGYRTVQLFTKEAGFLTASQFETIRRLLRRILRRSGKIWNLIVYNTIKTRKPDKIRMGKGKGRFKFRAIKLRPGKGIFEIRGLSQAQIKVIFKKISFKLPFKLGLLYS